MRQYGLSYLKLPRVTSLRAYSKFTGLVQCYISWHGAAGCGGCFFKSDLNKAAYIGTAYPVTSLVVGLGSYSRSQRMGYLIVVPKL
jgi:hypothetical protein